MKRSVLVLFLVLALIPVSFASRPAGQGRVPFTAEDMLKVASISVSDMTDDGRIVSAIVRRAYDNAETDNYRYGDPTYLGPSRGTLLVIDATTGQNGLRQAQEFQQAVDVSGVVLTKLDGTAKGGIIFAITDELKIPVRYVGVGEGLDDLQPFDHKAFVEALFEPMDLPHETP